MKKIYFLMLLFWGLTFSEAFAQSDSLLSRHEVGMDFLPLFRNEVANNQPASLLYRKYLPNGAFRVRLQAGYSQLLDDGAGDEFYRNGSGAVRVGKEWHLQFEKMRFYYGADVKAGFSYHYVSRTQPTAIKQTSHAIEAGILPLLGFQYAINRHFGLGTEANSQVGITRFWEEASGFEGGAGNSRRDIVGFQLFNEFALFLTYRF